MLPQELLKYFGVLATAWVGSDVGLQLQRVPTELVIEAVDEAPQRFTARDRVSLYRLLAHDSRKEVYSRVKDSLARDKQHSALPLLAQDEEPEVQEMVIDALRAGLLEAEPRERTRLATSFALASESGPRLILARALAGDLVQNSDYLYVLANDADELVRLTAVEATKRMFLSEQAKRELDSHTLFAAREIFETRLHDSVGAIRKKARRGYAMSQFSSTQARESNHRLG